MKRRSEETMTCWKGNMGMSKKWKSTEDGNMKVRIPGNSQEGEERREGGEGEGEGE
jgi:hypothetical protein